ncbi:General transcription factor 3C polypeptide 5 [Bulinus truncatus]|nr:General transcription factor 3C polypeptide 5 [Bulinus truncatus]
MQTRKKYFIPVTQPQVKKNYKNERKQNNKWKIFSDGILWNSSLRILIKLFEVKLHEVNRAMESSPKPSCSKTLDSTDSPTEDMEVEDITEEDEAEMSNLVEPEEEDEAEMSNLIEPEEEDGAEMARLVEPEEEADEQEDVDENEEGMVSKTAENNGQADRDLFDEFEFGTNRAEKIGAVNEEIALDVGGWTDSNKVCTAAVNLSRKFVCIEYPGVIKNVDRALNTLGGPQTICTCFKENHRLELSFRPKDPYCKPVISSVFPSRNLLLKIRRRPKPKSSSDPGEHFEYQLEVMGAVDSIHKFDKMCDFQYLPVIKLPDGQYKEILSVIQPKIDDEREEYLSRKTPLFLPPYCFSRREVPTNFFFDNETVQDGETTLKNDRKKRFLGVIHRTYNNPDVPARPEPAAAENVAKFPEHNQKVILDLLTKFFEERPLWIKTAIIARLDFAYHRLLKHLLPMVAYYIETGPWRNLWCKFGYDPRKDPKAKIYQTLDFRLRTTTNKNQVEAKRGVEAPRYIHSTKKNVPVHKTPIHHVVEEQTDTPPKLNPSGLDLTYIFSPVHRPPYRQMRYQVCDVMDDRVQKMLHENDGKETECTERDGWCVPDFTDMCRDILSEAVEKLFPN